MADRRTALREISAALLAGATGRGVAPPPPAGPEGRRFDVRAYGAVGNGSADDTGPFRRALAAAGAARGAVLVPAGAYRITGTLTLTEHAPLGASLVGAGLESAVLLSELRGRDPLLRLAGGSGNPSNVRIAGVTLRSRRAGEGTALLLDGQCFAHCGDVSIDGFGAGVWLFNDSPGAFTEFNVFRELWIGRCTNAIRLERGRGTESFHGNVFENVVVNLGAGETGLNLASGFFYNGRFDITLFSHHPSAVYVNADGLAEHCGGQLRFESFAPGRLTGRGRFWWHGTLDGIGPLADESAPEVPHGPVFACANYWSPASYAGSGLALRPLAAGRELPNGPFPLVARLSGDQVESVLVNVYRAGTGNGLYIGASGFAQPAAAAQLGLFLDGTGAAIRTYNPAGLQLQDAAGRPALRFDAAGVSLDRDLVAPGGFRQVVDGWYVPADQLRAGARDLPLPRLGAAPGWRSAWCSVRDGSITGLLLRAESPRAAGSLTAVVWRNGSPTGARAVLDAEHPGAHAVTFAKDAFPFSAGDALDVRLTADAAWRARGSGGGVASALEVES